MKLKPTILLPTALVLISVSSQAGTVLSFNFDSTTPDYMYGYTYSEFGSGSHDNGVISPTGGVGGTAGFVTTFNTTGMSGGWAGVGAGTGDWRASAKPGYASLINATSLADISLSLDARAGGLTGASANVTFELKFEAPDNTILPNDANTDTDVLLTLKSTRSLTSTFQNFTSTLDTWTIDNGSFAQLKTYTGGLGNINLNIAYDASGTLAAFGNDTGNFIAVDNYVLSVVPEPSTLTLLGLGGLAVLFRRR